MNEFLIYFDESNKLDQKKHFSYYGAYGGTSSVLHRLNKEVQEIFSKLNTKSELHFSEYTKDTEVKKYFQCVTNILNNENIYFRLFVVNNKDAFGHARSLGVDLKELRNLFYIKIPERLFYGMVRDIEDSVKIKIVVDANSEYDEIELHTKLKDQMNAHSAYRNKKYYVTDVVSSDSKDELSIQIADILMGIVVFLMEKEYYEETNVTIVKSDLLYRVLIEGNNLKLLQENVIIYKWQEGNNMPLRIPFSEYIAEFFLYKTTFDVNEMGKLQKIMLQMPDKATKEYREYMGYPNSKLRLLLGYKDQIEGKGRNFFLKL